MTFTQEFLSKQNCFKTKQKTLRNINKVYENKNLKGVSVPESKL